MDETKDAWLRYKRSTDDAAADDRRRPVLRHALLLPVQYLRSDEWMSAAILLVVAIALRLGLAGLAIMINRWEKQFFDALAARATDLLWPLVLSFALLGLIAVGVAVGDVFFRELLAIRWRRWMTRQRLDRWLADDRYVEMERRTLLDNPDQRISEDIRYFTRQMVELTTSFVGFLASSIGFGVVLWTMSAESASAGGGVTGDLFWWAVAYALLGSALVTGFARPLVRRSMRQERYEANFRFDLVTIRRNAERIAVAGDAGSQAADAGNSLSEVVRNAVALLRVRSGLQGFTNMFSLAQGVVPLVIVMDRYFSGAMSLGDVMQARGAFVAFAASLSWFVQNFSQIGATAATANRIFTFDTALARDFPTTIVRAETGEGTVVVRDLVLRHPDGRPLLHVDRWTVRPSECWLVEGPGGAGKSTLLRAIVGQWLHGEGTIAAPVRARIAVVTSDSWLRAGRLADVVRIDAGLAAGSGAEDVEVLLDRIGLKPLIARLDDAADWKQVLSTGEQQRLAFVRALLAGPDLLLIDEASASLSEECVAAIDCLLRACPSLAVIEISQRGVRQDMHTHRAIIEGHRFTIDPLG